MLKKQSVAWGKGGEVQGGYVQRNEVIVKIAKQVEVGPVQGWGGGQS